jgi:hypothetical protein
MELLDFEQKVTKATKRGTHWRSLSIDTAEFYRSLPHLPFVAFVAFCSKKGRPNKLACRNLPPVLPQSSR